MTSLPKRPGYAAKVTLKNLEANYYTITPKRRTVLHEYSVRFDPKEKTARDARFKILRVLQERVFQGISAATIATDFRGIIVTAQALNLPSLNSNDDPTGVLAPENPLSKIAVNTKYWIRLTKSHDIDQLLAYLANPGTGLPNKDEIIKVLNIVVSRLPSSQGGIVTNHGKNYFKMDQNPLFLDNTENITALYGLTSSVRTSTNRLLLNVNAITAAYVVPKPLLQFKGAYRDDLETFAKTIRSTRVQHEFRQTVESKKKKEPFTSRLVTKTVQSIARWDPIRKTAADASATFKREHNGTETWISVKDYFDECKILI